MNGQKKSPLEQLAASMCTYRNHIAISEVVVRLSFAAGQEIFNLRQTDGQTDRQDRQESIIFSPPYIYMWYL